MRHSAAYEPSEWTTHAVGRNRSRGLRISDGCPADCVINACSISDCGSRRSGSCGRAYGGPFCGSTITTPGRARSCCSNVPMLDLTYCFIPVSGRVHCFAAGSAAAVPYFSG